MAFNIVLQTNNSDKNVLDKSLTNIATISGTLKNETSIINPVILITGNLTTYVNCNYMTISTFGRSYFVTDIRSIRNGLIEVSGHVDVLTSYKNQIRENTGIIHRQENLWNLYLNDGAFRVYQNPIVLTKEFSTGFSTPEFVLAVAGG